MFNEYIKFMYKENEINAIISYQVVIIRMPNLDIIGDILYFKLIIYWLKKKNIKSLIFYKTT